MLKAHDYDPKQMIAPGDAEDHVAEEKFLRAFHDEDDERFGNPATGDMALQIAFRAGMAWARLKG